MFIVTASFSESFVFKIGFCPHENAKAAFSISSGLKSVFEKLHFGDE